MSDAVLDLSHVTLDLPTDRGVLRPVDGISFRVEAGRTLAIVGESGCGKSVTALAIMGLLPGQARIGGDIRLDGEALLSLSPEARRAKRGISGQHPTS